MKKNVLKLARDENEIALIKGALQKSGGVVTQAAKALGVPERTLWRRIKRFGLQSGFAARKQARIRKIRKIAAHRHLRK